MPPRNIRRPAALLAAAALTLPIALGASLPAVAAPPSAGPAAGTQKVVDLSSTAAVAGLEIENSFVSAVGWVKPGDSYPSRILLSNTTAAPIADIRVAIDKVTGMTVAQASPAGAGEAVVTDGSAVWTVPSLAAGAAASLVLEHRAATTAAEPTIVWRNLSSLATVSVGGGEPATVQSHGPKVIPPSGGYETARYGDRPFPVVPVDYANVKHQAVNTASKLDDAINGRDNIGSTFNLYQEMSFGQLFPQGDVGSVVDGVARDEPYDPGLDLRFTTQEPATTNTCQTPANTNPTDGSPNPITYTERIVDGWYQLPSTREYYGSDANGSAVVGSAAGVGALQAIDSGCGPTAKAAYDAAVVADPDIDYSDFDTDKDGVVDFFEVIFQGCGGNGASQLGVAGGCEPTDTGDNIWPHSSSLEFTYVDAATGLSGYISADPLRDLEGFPLWYTDTTRQKMTRTDKGADLVVYVRVGPYNVNPETSIDKASVISHEYGHSLGLPDYYSTGNRDTYGDFNLMATDKSHHMDVIGKKELGWIVPNVLPAGETAVTGWADSKVDTGIINWLTPDGTPYTLDASAGDLGIHNGTAYAAALPGRQLIDPAKVTNGENVWFSGSGNDYGCVPTGAHNFDIAIPGLEKVAPGTTITASLRSFFDIEWDYDYGFTMTGTPANANGTGSYTYTAQPSLEGYTTNTSPNTASCLTTYGNGLTGTGISHATGTAATDSVLGTYDTVGNTFVPDSYDISDLAGVKGGVLRFSYYTDPGLARPGWFIDDLEIKAGDTVLYSSDFEDAGGSTLGSGGVNDPALYPGGCKEDLSSANGTCTPGWSYVTAGDPSAMEHGYLMEMRDRSGFDVNGNGENDRADIAFEPGLLLTYTDEAHGYGNVGTDNPPAQSPLDSVPEPRNSSPNLNDATFVPGGARAVFSDASVAPHTDNYDTPTGGWVFDYDCLGFTVDSMSGTDAVAAKNLVGAVTFTTDEGCAPFNYGLVSSSDTGPTPVVPEVPVAVLLPLAAAVVAGVAFARRRRTFV